MSPSVSPSTGTLEREDAGFTGSLVAVTMLLLATLFVYLPGSRIEIVDVDYADWIAAATPAGLEKLKLIFSYDRSTWEHLGYFAPLTAASFMVDVWLSAMTGGIADVHRFINLGLHLANGLLVLVLMRLLGFKQWTAFTVAALFLLHPLQVSSIAWVPERKNLLVALFFLAGLASYVRFRQSGRAVWYGAAVLGGVLSLLCKPTAVAFGPCALLADWFLIDRRFQWKSVVRAIPFLAMGLVWAIVAAGTEPFVQQTLPLLDRILLIPYGLGFMLWKFFVPMNLSFIYPAVKVSASSWVWWLPLVITIAVCTALLFVHGRLPLWPVLWATGFYVVLMMPSSGLVPFGGMKDLYVADHYVYLALIGPAAVLAIVIERIATIASTRQASGINAALTACAATILAAVSITQVRIWESPERLWQNVISRNASSYAAHSNYGTYLDERGRHDEALSQYHQALAINSSAYTMWYNIGVILMNRGDARGAALAFARTLELRPGFEPAQARLAEIFERQ